LGLIGIGNTPLSMLTGRDKQGSVLQTTGWIAGWESSIIDVVRIRSHNHSAAENDPQEFLWIVGLMMTMLAVPKACVSFRK